MLARCRIRIKRRRTIPPGTCERPRCAAVAGRAPAVAGRSVPGAGEPGLPSPPSADPGTRMAERGLAVWLGIVTAGFFASALFEQAELGLMIALAGMFAVAHAVDVDRGGRCSTGSSPGSARRRDADVRRHRVVLPPPAAAGRRAHGRNRRLARRRRRLAAAGGAPAHQRPRPDDVRRRGLGPADRLGARLVALGFLLAVPGWLLVRGLAEAGVIDSLALDAPALIGSMAGFTLLSLGGVGLLVRRDVRAAAARLGLARCAPRPPGDDRGLAAILGLQLGCRMGRQRVPAGRVRARPGDNERIAGRLTRGETLLLGISAGVGEELAMRGALQPRLGLVTTRCCSRCCTSTTRRSGSARSRRSG